MSFAQIAAKAIDFKNARKNMVNGQLLTNGIYNRALVDAYKNTPREKFLDGSMAASAYLDEDTPIVGTSRWLLDPLVEARMLQHALNGPHRHVLAVGAASLPTIEMLATIVTDVLVIEPDKGLASAAKLRLERPNVTIIETGYKEGYPKQAPYDLIVMTGAAAEIPEFLKAQLVVGGKLVGVLRPTAKACGKIIVLERLSQDIFDTIYDVDALTPYLEGFEPKPAFVF